MNERATENKTQQKILVLQGPNLNLLGEREPEKYGLETLEVLHLRIQEKAEELGLVTVFFQSNHEGELIDRIQDTRMENTAGIIINPAGLSHTSISLRDALASVSIPFIEIHISNIFAREKFRRHSYISELASGVITGTGVYGYILSLYAINNVLNNKAF